MHDDILCVILGGGRGVRLSPLTRDRAKPAVPLFGKYRLIDIPISNCINSGFTKINILTQFNSESLNKHVSRTYKFDRFNQGYVDIIAADQTMDDVAWFQGPADAVRKSLKHFNNPKIKYICVLSGDQLYKMDLEKFYEYHVERRAELTIACNLIRPEEVPGFGIIGTEPDGRIGSFVEKPESSDRVKKLAVTRNGEERFLCSMGIYFFNKDCLGSVLKHSGRVDFGKEVIPEATKTHRVFAYEFDGYWRDIGTIKSFYAENLRQADARPPMDLFDENWPIFTRSRSLPPAKCVDARIEQSIVAEGSLIDRAAIKHSVIGVRSRVSPGAVIEESVVMGADYYESDQDVLSMGAAGKIPVGIGPRSIIKGAILDKNARIGADVKIVNEKAVKEAEGPNYVIRDGIVIVFKNGEIPSGTVI
jgi:glucose-1-phosphate adenylyltransferase